MVKHAKIMKGLEGTECGDACDKPRAVDEQGGSGLTETP